MGEKIKAREDAATSTRATERVSSREDRLDPQHNNSTAPANRQAWDLQTEIRLINALLAPYNKQSYRRLSRSVREVIYRDGVRLVCSYPFSPSANEYGRKTLAKHLRT